MCVVCNAWCVVRGAWCVVRGAWCVMLGAYRLVIKDDGVRLSVGEQFKRQDVIMSECRAAWYGQRWHMHEREWGSE